MRKERKEILKKSSLFLFSLHVARTPPPPPRFLLLILQFLFQSTTPSLHFQKQKREAQTARVDAL